MTTDTAHTLIAVASLALIAYGCWTSWGVGLASLVVGGILLLGIVYARTRT